MLRNLLIGTAISFLLVILAGCSSTAVSPTPGDEAIGPTNTAGLTQYGSDITGTNRSLWGYWNISYDPETQKMEAVPLRTGEIHLNVLRPLEVSMCLTCLVIGNNEIVDDVLTVEISIIHPISTDGQYKKEVFTGFDVRGIAIFEGTHFFDGFGKKIATYANDNFTVVNADGYTRLWSPADFPPGSIGRYIFEYFPGKYEVNGVHMTTTLNPYKAYFTQPERRYFQAGLTNMQEYEIRLPDGPVPLEFGYAVDASWVAPANLDNPAVPNDFPPNANSIEAYRIDAQFTGALTPIGGEVTATLNIYDWQGANTIEPDPNGVKVECIELFNDKISATFVADYGAYAQYTVKLHNDLAAEIGSYPLLVAVSDVQAVPIIGDVDAYNVFYVNVVAPLELIATVAMDHYPIEGAFNPANHGCYFGPIPGTQYVKVQGIDQAHNTINGFPELEWVTGGVGLCNGSQQMFVATDLMLPADGCKDDVHVFKLGTKALDYTISIPPSTNELGANPIDFAVFENMQEVWVSLYSDNEVGSFPAGTSNPVISRYDTGTGPTTIAIDTANYRIFVACDGTDTITVVDGFTHATETITLHTPMESPDPGLPATPGMAYVPNNDTLYVTTMLYGTVDCYNMATKTWIKSIQLASGSEVVGGLVYDPGTNMLIATGSFGAIGHVWAIDPGTNAEIYEAETTGATPMFPAVDPDNSLVYVPDPAPGTGHVDIFQIVN